MPAFRDDQILIIAPGSQTTLAQLGLPESFTPARYRLRSRMFAAQKAGEYEPVKVRQKQKAKLQVQETATAEQQQQPPQTETKAEPASTENPTATDNAAVASDAVPAEQKPAPVPEEPEWEEDLISEEGAIWPIQQGQIVDWPCFYALITHVYNTVNPPFHTPIMLIGEPCWTVKDHERLTQFFFEKFKTPAFAIMDAALATVYAYGVPSAVVVDVGLEKADVTCVADHVLHRTSRSVAVPSCGGEAMTQRLVELLGGRAGFNKDVCEQLKRSGICEILPSDVEIPGEETNGSSAPENPAAAASTGAAGTAPGQQLRPSVDIPRGPGPGTEVGEESRLEDEDGVLDIASIVTGGNMTGYLEQKAKEKQEKAAAKQQKKTGGADAQAAQRPVRLPNHKRKRNTFLYEDYALHEAMKKAGVNSQGMADMQTALGDATSKRQKSPEAASGQPTAQPAAPPSSTAPAVQDASAATAGAPNAAGAAAAAPPPTTPAQPPTAPPATTLPQPEGPAAVTDTGPTASGFRREIEVGPERFRAATGGILDRLADTIHRTVLNCNDGAKRSDLWDSVIVVGNGAKVRGFKDALLETLQKKFLISPSSATIFTSELPSNLSTPMGTGSQTPTLQHQAPQQQHGGVNPLLLAATTAGAAPPPSAAAQQTPPHQQPPNPYAPVQSQYNFPAYVSASTSHAQTPTSIKVAKIPEYFPEWKDAGFDEAQFLGAQVAAKVIFVSDGGASGAYLTRSAYNESGPGGISETLL